MTQGIWWDSKNFSPSHISNLHILCCLSYICVFVFVFVFTHPQLANPYLLLCHSSSLWWQGGQLVFGLPEFSAFIGLFQVIQCTPCLFCECFSHLAFWNVNVFLVWQWATVERKEGPKRSLEIGCTLSLVGHSCNGTTSQSGFLGHWGSFFSFHGGRLTFWGRHCKVFHKHHKFYAKYDVTTRRLQITRMRTSWLVWAVER